MDQRWSQYVQATEGLNRSRALRFSARNREIWLDALRATDGMDVLELGCVGGIFCQRIKEYRPNARVTGLDRDGGHIAYARRDAAARGLAVDFVIGDATAAPFPDASFDLCFSYTVAEHIEPDAFFSEQHRLLRPGGRVAALCVLADRNIHIRSEETNAGGEEKALLKKARDACPDTDGLIEVCKYPFYPKDAGTILARNGFVGVDIEIFTVTGYAPDNAAVSDAEAIESFEAERFFALGNR